ncbi:TraM recognition domain-containing protein [Empedobacter falsenii]
MQNKRTGYIIFSLFISIILFITYIHIITSGNEHSFIKSFLSNSNITEFRLKLYFLIPLVAISMINVKFSDKEYNIYSIIINTSICVGFILLPVRLFNFIPSFIYIILLSIAYIGTINYAFIISIYYFSNKFKQDQFNTENQTFKQTNKLVKTDSSINIEYSYYYNNQWRKGWINIINVFSSIWVYGIMGCGKSFTWFTQAIYQLMQKKFAMLVYDFKFPAQSKEVYILHKKLKSDTELYFICLDDIRYSHRCNIIERKNIPTISDMESMSNILIGGISSDKEKSNPFFDGSAQGILTGLIAICKKWEEKYNVKVCSFPHVMLLSTIRIEIILPILLSEKELLMQVTALRDAFLKEDAGGQLAGQTATLSVHLRKLFSKEMLYILSGTSDFDLDLNDFNNPKILCIGSDQQKAHVVAPIVSLFFEVIAKKTNVENKVKRPFMMFADEFSRLYFTSLKEYLTTGRSNKCGIMAGAQSIKHINEAYPKEANSILDVQGTIIVGQSGNETAKYMSERLGKTNQKKYTVSDSYNINYSTEKDYLIPQSRISTQSVGEFCGVITDEYNNTIEQKRFMGKISVDKEIQESLKEKEIPVIRDFETEKVKKEVEYHINEMIHNDFYFQFFIFFIQPTISYDLISIENNYLKFYLKFMDINNDMIDDIYQHIIKEIYQPKSIELKRKEMIYDDIETAFIERINHHLKEKIIQKEMNLFLDKNLEKLYSEIEYCVKKEYKTKFGEELTIDLFNVIRTKEHIIEDETIF